MKFYKLTLGILFPLNLLFLFTLESFGSTGNWNSSLTNTKLSFKVTESAHPIRDFAGKQITVVYLENLNIEKVGQNNNETDVAWLLSHGFRVVELDYQKYELAVSPNINLDIIAINDQIAEGSFCGLNNCSQYQSYVLFEGYRIRRNVAYFLDDPTVYNKPSQYTVGDSLYMDIVFPANPKEEIPVVLSFSYSNSYATYDGDRQTLTDANKHQRLNLFNTLAGFNDSFLEGAPGAGVAWAIADHPKYCPWGGGKPTGGTNDTYKSYQANPDAGQKVRSAVRTLRVIGQELGLSDKIGIYGFSRGSDAGSMAIGTRKDVQYDNAGLNIGISDTVQVALLGPGVFDYTLIYNSLNDGDGNLELRCPWAWGTLTENFLEWKTKGAEYLVESSQTAPVLFFYNKDDSHYYQDQIAHLQDKLRQLNVPVDSIVNHGSGHSVPQDLENLEKMYNFLLKHFNSNGSKTGMNEVEFPTKLNLSVYPNPVENELHLSFSIEEAIELNLEVSDVSGIVIFSSKKYYTEVGRVDETIDVNWKSYPKGMYNIVVYSNFVRESLQFVKA